jgi:hypothetical protein
MAMARVTATTVTTMARAMAAMITASALATIHDDDELRTIFKQAKF